MFDFPKTPVPVGVSFFPKELVRFPKAYVIVSCANLFPLSLIVTGVMFPSIVWCEPYGTSYSSRNTKLAVTLRRTRSPMSSWETLEKCLASLGPPQVSYLGVVDIDWMCCEVFLITRIQSCFCSFVLDAAGDLSQINHLFPLFAHDRMEYFLSTNGVCMQSRRGQLRLPVYKTKTNG
jgi:hypothetical protein